METGDILKKLQRFYRETRNFREISKTPKKMETLKKTKKNVDILQKLQRLLRKMEIFQRNCRDPRETGQHMLLSKIMISL